MRVLKDKTGELEQLSKHIQEEFEDIFGPLVHLKILYAWNTPAKFDVRRNQFIHGTTTKFSNKLRDLFGYDALICIAQDIWAELSQKQRYQLIWHELYHLEVLLDEASEPLYDNGERVRFRLRVHDTNLERFTEELARFGFRGDELAITKRLFRLYKKHRKDDA